MKRNDGKITFFTLFLMAALVYGGFVAFKYITFAVTNKQIEKEVIDTFGPMRGVSFTPEAAKEVIIDIVKKYPVIFTDQYQENVEVTFEPSDIRFRFNYDVELDFIFFKQLKQVEVKSALRRYL